eukprot:scaffold6189_cov33-Phaeocystis_antarctica.AAC.1
MWRAPLARRLREHGLERCHRRLQAAAAAAAAPVARPLGSWHAPAWRRAAPRARRRAPARRHRLLRHQHKHTGRGRLPPERDRRDHRDRRARFRRWLPPPPRV